MALHLIVPKFVTLDDIDTAKTIIKECRKKEKTDNDYGWECCKVLIIDHCLYRFLGKLHSWRLSQDVLGEAGTRTPTVT